MLQMRHHRASASDSALQINCERSLAFTISGDGGNFARHCTSLFFFFMCFSCCFNTEERKRNKEILLVSGSIHTGPCASSVRMCVCFCWHWFPSAGHLFICRPETHHSTRLYCGEDGWCHDQRTACVSEKKSQLFIPVFVWSDWGCACVLKRDHSNAMSLCYWVSRMESRGAPAHMCWEGDSSAFKWTTFTVFRLLRMLCKHTQTVWGGSSWRKNMDAGLRITVEIELSGMFTKNSNSKVQLEHLCLFTDLVCTSPM